jgi:hypothetical protein
MEARAEAFEAQRDRKIAARCYDRDLDAVKAEKRIERQREEEERLEVEERWDQQKDAEATIRRGILERRRAKRARSEARWDAIQCWGTVAAIIAVAMWLAG